MASFIDKTLLLKTDAIVSRHPFNLNRKSVIYLPIFIIILLSIKNYHITLNIISKKEINEDFSFYRIKNAVFSRSWIFLISFTHHANLQ